MSERMNTRGLQFRAAQESMSAGMIAALVDIADGYPFMPAPYIARALEDYGLIKPLWDQIPLYAYSDVLTDLGRAFVAWMRQPREVSQQLDLF